MKFIVEPRQFENDFPPFEGPEEFSNGDEPGHFNIIVKDEFDRSACLPISAKTARELYQYLQKVTSVKFK